MIAVFTRENRKNIFESASQKVNNTELIGVNKCELSRFEIITIPNR